MRGATAPLFLSNFCPTKSPNRGLGGWLAREGHVLQVEYGHVSIGAGKDLAPENGSIVGEGIVVGEVQITHFAQAHLTGRGRLSILKTLNGIGIKPFFCEHRQGWSWRTVSTITLLYLSRTCFYNQNCMKDILLTEEGIQKLKSELKQLIDVDRKEIIRKIKETREYGDLSENAEYDAARNNQSMIEGRIEELEALLKKAKVIDSKKATASHDKVVIGSKVMVEIEGDEEAYTLVGSAESDPATGMISIESPLGQALNGAKVGQVVEVAIPDGGTVAYKIVKIN